VIQLADGQLKPVEELRTEDFMESADITPRLSIDSSRVVHMRQNHENGTEILAFEVGKEHRQVCDIQNKSYMTYLIYLLRVTGLLG